MHQRGANGAAGAGSLDYDDLLRVWAGVSGLSAGFFYLKGIEDICGIRASWVGGMRPEGAIATVYGLMSATADGERCLCVSTLTIAGGNQ